MAETQNKWPLGDLIKCKCPYCGHFDDADVSLTTEVVTFAHRVLNATQGDLAVTQLLLGHKSISTTGIYVKADLSQRLHAIQSLALHSIQPTQI